jgi:hypothetical protein
MARFATDVWRRSTLAATSVGMHSGYDRSVGRQTTLVVVAMVMAACAAGTPVVLGADRSTWVAQANAVCKVWQQKAAAALGANPKRPTTLKGMFAFMLKALPIESGELHALAAITAPRPAGAARALSLGSMDVLEIEAGIVAYRSGKRGEFVHDVTVWQSDHRTSRAFAALGAPACT